MQSLWDKSLQTNLDVEMRGRIIGAKSAMPILEYYFGISIGKNTAEAEDVIHPGRANGEVNQGSYFTNAK